MLQAVSFWLRDKKELEVSERDRLLMLIKSICQFRRNPLGLCLPHSAQELEVLLDEKKLTPKENLWSGDVPEEKLYQLSTLYRAIPEQGDSGKEQQLRTELNDLMSGFNLDQQRNALVAT